MLDWYITSMLLREKCVDLDDKILQQKCGNHQNPLPNFFVVVENIRYEKKVLYESDMMDCLCETELNLYQHIICVHTHIHLYKYAFYLGYNISMINMHDMEGTKPNIEISCIISCSK